MLSYLTTAFFENLSETFGFVLFIVWVVEGLGETHGNIGV